MYTHPYSYLLNMIRVHSNAKNMQFVIPYTQRIHQFLRVLKKIGLIGNYTLQANEAQKVFFYINVVYYKRMLLTKNCKIISKPSKSYFISKKALQLLDQRSSQTFYIISNSFGLLTHKESILLNQGGVLMSYINI